LGALHPTRDLVFVEDTVKGFIEIAKSDKVLGEEINIATESEISVGDLAEKIKAVIGANAEIVTDQKRIRPKDSEVERLLGGKSKIEELTACKPSVALDEGLKRTVNWFKNPDNVKLYKADIYNV